MNLELSVLSGDCRPLLLIKNDLAGCRITTHGHNRSIVTSLVQLLPLDFFSEGNLQRWFGLLDVCWNTQGVYCADYLACSTSCPDLFGLPCWKEEWEHAQTDQRLT